MGKVTEGPDRHRREFELQMLLGASLRVSRGFAASETGDVFERARELGELLDDPRAYYSAVWSLWMFNSIKRPRLGMSFAEELLDVAEREGDDEFKLQAHHAVWQSATCLADFRVARDHFDLAMEIYDAERDRAHMDSFGSHDPEPCGLVFKGISCWMLGEIAEAEACASNALQRAAELGHPFSAALATLWVATMHQFRDEGTDVVRRAREVVDFANEYGFVYWRAVGAILEGWGVARNGDLGRGLQLLLEAMALYDKTGALWMRPYYFGLLADVYRRLGRYEEMERAVRDGLAAAAETTEGFYVPELHRLLGDCAGWSDAGAEEVEAHYRDALALAAAQEARSLELRAATSLARLLQGEGRSAEARAGLAPIVEWFGQIDSPDLAEARATLAELV